MYACMSSIVSLPTPRVLGIETGTKWSEGSGWGIIRTEICGSRSNSTYKDNNKVRPYSTKVKFVIKY